MKIIINFIDKNRKLIIIITAIIAFIFIGIPTLNKLEGQRQQRQYEREQANKVVLTEEERNLPTKSIIGASSVSLKKTKQNFSLIEQFVEKCNNKDIEGAYNMLTDDCKQALYKTKEAFESGYYKTIFSTRKLVDMENFICVDNRYTYYAKFYDDILSTGNIQKAEYFNDYVTIDDNSQNGKLNINGLIYRQQINRAKQVNGVKITILTQEVYKDNEKYEIKIENTTDKSILIDTRKKSNTLFLLAENGAKYNSNIAEIVTDDRIIHANDSRTYEMTFYKMYSTQAVSKGIIFLDIVPDLDKYIRNMNNEDKRVQIGVVI